MALKTVIVGRYIVITSATFSIVVIYAGRLSNIQTTFVSA